MSSTVNRDRLTGDPTGLVRRQEENEIGNLCRLARPAERVSLLRTREELGVVLLVHPAATVKIGHDDPWIDGIDAHAFWGELERRATRQLIDGRLAHADSAPRGTP